VGTVVAEVVAVVVPVADVDVVEEPAEVEVEEPAVVDVKALAVVDVDFTGLVVVGPVYSPT
jgi:hypothetical protein